MRILFFYLGFSLINAAIYSTWAILLCKVFRWEITLVPAVGLLVFCGTLFAFCLVGSTARPS